MTDIIPRRNFGWLPDIPDHRDKLLYGFGVEAVPGVNTAPALLPPAIDLTNRAEWPAVYDQGLLGSCVANALAAAIEYEQIKRLTADGQYAKNKFMRGKMRFTPSRLFTYYGAREYINLTQEDSGCYIRDAVKVAYNLGAPRETGWKYDETKFDVRPPKRTYNSAPFHKITSYRALETVNEVKRALAEDFPVIIGISVFNSFFWGSGGDIQMPTYDDTLLGGHAILLVGYDDATQYFKFRNSWGEEWGNNGYGRLPYSYVGYRNLSDDFWVITDSEYKERM
jgi:C1A family cysteine protease